MNPHHQAEGETQAKLPSLTLSPTVSHPVFQLLLQTAHVCLHSRKRVHTRLRQQDRTQGHTRRNRGRFGWGWYHYSRSVPHVHEHPRAGYQNGILCPFWVLAEGAPEERREPSEQRCAYACRCPEGVAAPLGCVIFFISDEIVACMTCSRNFFRFSRRSSLCCSCASCVSARSFSVLVFARKTTGDYFSRTPISARSWSRGLGFAIVLDLLF